MHTFFSYLSLLSIYYELRQFLLFTVVYHICIYCVQCLSVRLSVCQFVRTNAIYLATIEATDIIFWYPLVYFYTLFAIGKEVYWFCASYSLQLSYTTLKALSIKQKKI